MKKITLLTGLLSILVLFACKKKDEDNNDDDNDNNNPTSDLIILNNGSQTFSGNISDGKILTDLSWAWNSSMACFVEPVVNQYEGKHVFYRIYLPVNSTMDIYLTPTNSSDQIALYGYSKAVDNTAIPPNVSSCVSCEADPSNNNAPTTGDRHMYFNAISNPYSVIIGVAGAEGFNSGGFTIEIDIQS